MSEGFVPTHVVPSGGMDSWPRPDAAAAKGPRVDGGLEVQLVDELGDWGKVMFANTWTAWVDRRLLVDRIATPTGARPLALGSLTADRANRVALVGAALVAVSSMLPWLRGQAGAPSANAFDVSAQFLFDYKTTSTSGPKVGLVLLALAIAVVVALAKARDPRISRALGAVACGVAVLYVVQLQRLVSSAPGFSLTDFVGFGVVPAAVGGAVTALAPRLAARR